MFGCSGVRVLGAGADSSEDEFRARTSSLLSDAWLLGCLGVVMGAVVINAGLFTTAGCLVVRFAPIAPVNAVIPP